METRIIVTSERGRASSQILSACARSGSGDRRVALKAPDIPTVPIVEICPRQYGVGLVIITVLPRSAHPAPSSYRIRVMSDLYRYTDWTRQQVAAQRDLCNLRNLPAMRDAFLRDGLVAQENDDRFVLTGPRRGGSGTCRGTAVWPGGQNRRLSFL